MSVLLPHLVGVRIDDVALRGRLVRIRASTATSEAICWRCGRVSRRRHGRYRRRLADCAAGGREVVVELTVNRYFCDESTCTAVTFVEQVDGLTVRYGRQTGLAAQALQAVALALGGRAGSRLADTLAVPASRSTLLRVIRRIPDMPVAAPRVLGVDDFAKRRGHRYATILIDMDTHTPIDVLDDRSAETLAQWLIAHPGVEIVCRDRGGSYADGVNRGAPGAVQIADRWHLLHNLSGAVDKVVARHRRCLQRPAAAPAPVSRQRTARPSSGRRAANTRGRHAQVADLREQGMALRAIARALDISVRTVRRYARADTAEQLIAPNRTRGYRPLDAFKPYLQARYNDGVTVTAVLFAEITARGYHGSLRTVREFLATIRADTPPPATIPTTRQITSWIMRPEDKLSDEDKVAFKDALAGCEDLRILTSYAHGFTALVRQLGGARLPTWIADASKAPFPEVRSFAKGLLNDLDAVTNGLTTTWSSGAVEGHVNRIKTIKRQMYGRAKLDLLRRRILTRT